MYSSKKSCVVLMKKLCSSKDYYLDLVAQGCMKVNFIRNGRLDETQPEMELLEVAVFIYPFSLKAGSSILCAIRTYLFNTAS